MQRSEMPKDSLYLSEVAGSSEKERFPQYDCLVVCQHGQARSPAAVAALRRSGFTAASIHGGLKRMRELSEEDLTRFAARLKGTPIFCIMTEGEERHQLEFLKKMANHDLGILTVSDMDEILAWFKNKEEMNVHS